jgi:hypothetical protein
MIIDNRIAKIFLKRRFNQTKLLQTCSTSVINCKPITSKNYESKNQFNFLFIKSPIYSNSFPTIQIQRTLKGGSGYSNIAGPNYKIPPKKYSIYIGIAMAGVSIILFGFLLAIETKYDPETDTTSYKSGFKKLKAETIDEIKIKGANSNEKKDKKSNAEVNETEESETDHDDGDETSPKKKKKRISFKDKKVSKAHLKRKKNIFLVFFV